MSPAHSALTFDGTAGGALVTSVGAADRVVRAYQRCVWLIITTRRPMPRVGCTVSEPPRPAPSYEGAASASNSEELGPTGFCGSCTSSVFPDLPETRAEPDKVLVTPPHERERRFNVLSYKEAACFCPRPRPCRPATIGRRPARA